MYLHAWRVDAQFPECRSSKVRESVKRMAEVYNAMGFSMIVVRVTYKRSSDT